MGFGDPAPVDPVGGLGRRPLQRWHRVLVEQLQLDGGDALIRRRVQAVRGYADTE